MSNQCDRRLTVHVSGHAVQVYLEDPFDKFSALVKKKDIEDLVCWNRPADVIKFRLNMRKWLKEGQLFLYMLDITTKDDFLNNNFNFVDGLVNLYSLAKLVEVIT